VYRPTLTWVAVWRPPTASRTSRVVQAPASKLIAVVTRSGRLIGDGVEPELDSGVEVTVGPDSDPWADSLDEPDGPIGPVVRLNTSEPAQESPVPESGEGEVAESDYSSDSTEGDESDEEVPSDDDDEPSHGPDYSWSNDVMREEQDEDDVVSRVRAWVAMGAKPSPEELDAESQETRALVSRWSELAVVEGILVRLRQGSSQVVLPHKLRHGVLRHMHASPLSAGHMGQDRTYKRLRDKAWWPGY
jgi:hypothetical protein